MNLRTYIAYIETETETETEAETETETEKHEKNEWKVTESPLYWHGLMIRIIVNLCIHVTLMSREARYKNVRVTMIKTSVNTFLRY